MSFGLIRTVFNVIMVLASLGLMIAGFYYVLFSPSLMSVQNAVGLSMMAFGISGGHIFLDDLNE